ncbi:pimeloyl-CoA dehydrogenase small subunit [Sphingomonas sp. DBB INV C78]|uniref:acyl-CoA dehydrogenase family protein n=1 Tax=Sphingomonas sp. DBB INV C78 TaxID=3349434 RepID=UPI0036D3A829
MNFDLSEEQRLLRDLIDRYAGDRYDAVKRLRYVEEARGFSAEGWQLMAETGLLAFPFAEELGGLGGGSDTLITVMEAVGRSAMTEPVLPVIVLAGGVLARAGSDEQKAEWLPRLIDGSGFVALAHAEHNARFNELSVATRVAANGGKARIDGGKQMVLGGPFADAFIVSARSEKGVVGLYLVAADADGLERRDYRMADGSAASDLVFRQVAAEPLPGDLRTLERALDDTRLAISAELVGLMNMMFDATLDYVKTRNQFGQAIGQFQAIQHRMADNYSRLELSRSHLYRAAAIAPSDPGHAEAVAGAKAFIAARAIELGEDAIQLHGGIGTTEELMVGQAFKRVLLLASLLGDSDWELRRYVQLSASRH